MTHAHGVRGWGASGALFDLMSINVLRVVSGHDDESIFLISHLLKYLFDASTGICWQLAVFFIVLCKTGLKYVPKRCCVSIYKTLYCTKLNIIKRKHNKIKNVQCSHCIHMLNSFSTTEG